VLIPFSRFVQIKKEHTLFLCPRYDIAIASLGVAAVTLRKHCIVLFFEKKILKPNVALLSMLNKLAWIIMQRWQSTKP